MINTSIILPGYMFLIFILIVPVFRLKELLAILLQLQKHSHAALLEFDECLNFINGVWKVDAVQKYSGIEPFPLFFECTTHCLYKCVIFVFCNLNR